MQSYKMMFIKTMTYDGKEKQAKQKRCQVNFKKK